MGELKTTAIPYIDQIGARTNERGINQQSIAPRQ
jgi:hypothetical protein